MSEDEDLGIAGLPGDCSDLLTPDVVARLERAFGNGGKHDRTREGSGSIEGREAPRAGHRRHAALSARRLQGEEDRGPMAGRNSDVVLYGGSDPGQEPAMADRIDACEGANEEAGSMKYKIWIHIEEQDGSHDPTEACEPLEYPVTFRSFDKAVDTRWLLIDSKA